MQVTLGDVLSMSANRYPSKEAVIYGDWRQDYRTLERRANMVGNALLGLGLRKGDRCAILFYNRGEWAEVYFGLARTGIIAVPVNFRFAESEIEYVLNNSEAEALIYEEAFVEIIERIKTKAGSVKHYICLGQSADRSYADWLVGVPEDPPQAEVNENDPFFIGYTSGTTGFPKGAVVPHKSLITHYLISAKEFGNTGSGDTILLIMPLFHSNSTWNLQSTLMMGGTIVIYHSMGFDPEEILGLIHREKVTYTSLVPTMLTMILNLPDEVKARYDITSLRKFIVSSAPIMTKTKEEAVKMFKGVEIYEGYGSTETGAVTVLKPEDQLHRERSIGVPTVGKEVRLLDDQGNDVKLGEIGELYAKGLGILLSEYWKNDKASSLAFRGEWCTVGDMARMDEEGYIYLEDRKKDMIISGGENVYPTEVENILVRHPAVLEAAVVGVPDEHWGEKVHAVIVPRKGMEVDLQELLDFCKDKLAGYKRPKSIEMVDSLPKSATGKTLRRKVRELYWGTGKSLYL